MTGEELGAIGETAGGAGAARAVEPGHGEAAGAAQSGRCLNCGCALEGAYCHCCGQKAHLHFTLGGLVHDIVHGVLHLDGKFWRTLPMLAWRPGELTREYVEGKRARYISPIAFYLFTVVAMFALVVSVGEIDEASLSLNSASDIETVEEAEEKLAELDATLADMADDDYPGASGARAGVRAQRDAVEQRRDTLAGEAAGERGSPIKITRDEEDGFLSGLGAAFQKAEANPSLFLYKVQTTAYKLSWLLIPLSLPFMWLLFPFSKRHGLYKHAVFVTYSISFMMVLVLNIGLWTWLGAEEVGIVFAVFYAPFHLYRQLRGAYGLGRLSAIIRTVILSIFSWVVLALFVAIMFALGALG